MRLLCFDPGDTTGWAYFEDGEIIGGAFPLWARVDEMINEFKPDVIVFEAFYLASKAARHLIGSSIPTIEVIGVIKFLAKTSGIKYVSQPPYMRAGISLRRVRGLGTHSRDAARHGIRYLIREGDSAPYAHYRKEREER
jgi:hypothetical protein